MEQTVDAMERSIDSDSEMEYEILHVPWCLVLLEGIIAILKAYFFYTGLQQPPFSSYS